jgi:competence protein ComEA
MRVFIALFISLFLALPAWAGININTASAEELTSLPGIGPSKAAAIVDHRRQNGPFASVDQIVSVSGIGAKTLASIRSQIEVGDGRTVEVGAVPGAPPAPSGPTVNINTAAAAELDALPGIGPSKAAAIVADRDANGPFGSCGELSRVQGVGAKTVANIGTQCAVK